MAGGGTVATTADIATGTQATTDGMADGAGSPVGTIHGGCFYRQSFQSRFLTLTTADTDMGRGMDTDQGTGTAEDTEPRVGIRDGCEVPRTFA